MPTGQKPSPLTSARDSRFDNRQCARLDPMPMPTTNRVPIRPITRKPIAIKTCRRTETIRKSLRKTMNGCASRCIAWNATIADIITRRRITGRRQAHYGQSRRIQRHHRCSALARPPNAINSNSDNRIAITHRRTASCQSRHPMPHRAPHDCEPVHYFQPTRHA